MNNKMGDSIARKSFCEDVQSPAGKRTFTVLPLFSSLPVATYHLILVPLPPKRLEQWPQNDVSKSFITKWIIISKTSHPKEAQEVPFSRTFLETS